MEKQHRQCTCDEILKRVRVNGKTKIITHPDFLSVVLVIRHAKRVRRIVLPPVVCVCVRVCACACTTVSSLYLLTARYSERKLLKNKRGL